MRALTGSKTEKLNDTIEGRQIIRRLQQYVDQGNLYIGKKVRAVGSPEELEKNIEAYLKSKS